jgi:hypothetical protein
MLKLAGGGYTHVGRDMSIGMPGSATRARRYVAPGRCTTVRFTERLTTRRGVGRVAARVTTVRFTVVRFTTALAAGLEARVVVRVVRVVVREVWASRVGLAASSPIRGRPLKAARRK